MFVKPEEVLKNIGIERGTIMADFGAGSGHYVFAAAKMAGEDGRGYAIDIQKDLLGRIKSSAEEGHLENLEIIWANLENQKGSRLADRSLDIVIISNLLFQVETERRKDVILEAKRVLKPGGVVAVIDWENDSGTGQALGPSAIQRVGRDEMRVMCLQAGLKFEREFEAGDNHYGLLFKSP